MTSTLCQEQSKTGETQLQTLCAWCGRFKNPDGAWGQPTFVRARQEFTHGICPRCLIEVSRKN